MGILLVLMTFGQGTLETDLAGELARAQKKSGVFVVPSASQMVRAENLFLATLSGVRNYSLKKGWKRLGLIFEQHGDVWLLREVSNKGRGFYLFRDGPDVVESAVQVPHGLFDNHTDLLGLFFFLEGGYRAGTWNTIHRKSTFSASKSEADLAHLEISYLQAFTRAWLRFSARTTILQVHGFTSERRSDPVAASASVILSDGTAKPPLAMSMLAACLRGTGAGNIALFGRDTQELGGTTNSQGRLMAAKNGGRFLHLELGAQLRETLLIDGQLRKRLLTCLELW